MAQSPPLGRLALRQEGNHWVAYYALPGTMDGAVWLGAIGMALTRNPERKRAFMELMQEAVADLIEEHTGTRPVWPHAPTAAPEHERSGHD